MKRLRFLVLAAVLLGSQVGIASRQDGRLRAARQMPTVQRLADDIPPTPPPLLPTT